MIANRLGQPSTRRAIGHVGLVVLALAMTLVMLRPSPSEMDETLPANLGDPALVTWILRYGSHALTSDPLDVWDAPIFWPNDGGFAYSESMLPLAPVYGAIHSVAGDDVLSMNILIIGIFVFNVVMTFALARYLLGRSFFAPMVAAIAFSFSGYVMGRSGHPHLQPVGVFSLGYLATFRMLDRPSVARGVLAGIANGVAFLTCLYYGAIWSVCLAVTLIGWFVVRRIRLTRAAVAAFGAMALVSAVLILPVAREYAQQDLQRALDPALGLNLADVFVPAPDSYVHGWLDGRAATDVRFEHTYFPGFITIGLAAVGAGALLSARRHNRAGVRRSSFAQSQSVMLLLVAIGAAISVLLAIGPTFMGVPMPFRLLHDNVPGFSGIRVPSRMAVPALLAGALFAGVGALTIAERAGRRGAQLFAVAIPLLLLVELAAPTHRVEFERPEVLMAVYEELALRPDGAVVELPMPDLTDGVDWAFTEAPRMLRATVDWKPRVNGYSGAAPESYPETARIFESFPSSPTLAHAHRLDVRYVVVHIAETTGPGGYSEADARRIIDRLPAPLTAERYGFAWLIDLRSED